MTCHCGSYSCMDCICPDTCGLCDRKWHKCQCSTEPREYELENGRKYRAVYTKTPFIDGEYPKGGIVVHVWSTEWCYLANCESWEAVDEMMRLLKRLPERKERNDGQMD